MHKKVLLKNKTYQIEENIIFYTKANSTKDIFRYNLKFYRNKLNLTQEKLSELSGISSDYLSEIERGKRTPSFKRLDLIT